MDTDYVIFQVETLRDYLENNQIHEKLQHEYAVLRADGKRGILMNSLKSLIDNIEHIDADLKSLLGLIKTALSDYEKAVELEQKMWGLSLKLCKFALFSKTILNTILG